MKRMALGFALTACLVPGNSRPTDKLQCFLRSQQRAADADASAIVAIAAHAVRREDAGRIIISAGDPRFAEARFHSVQTALIAGGVNADRIARANLPRLRSLMIPSLRIA